MTKPKVPKTREAAIALLERRHVIGAELAKISATRDAAIAATNAVADKLATPLVDEAAALDAALEPWWTSAAANETGGKRKSVVLGGCKIGTKLSTTVLAHDFANDDEAVRALRPLTWAKPYLTVTYKIDRKGTLKALEGGRHQVALAALGFRQAPGEDRFFVEPVGQAGAAIDQPRG